MAGKEIKAEIKSLYDEIDLCIGELVKGRATHNETLVANARHKMESLMVQAQQVLSCISDAIEEPVSEDLSIAADDYSFRTFKENEKNTIFCNSSNAFKAGANWMKEQMIKTAVPALKLKNREKIKVIVIKEDEYGNRV